MPEQHDLVEDLVYECLERLAADDPAAVEELLAEHPGEVQQLVRETMATLQRVGLAGDESAGDVPEQLGPYRLLERLGSGAMGVVYRAKRTDDNGDLAIKLMQPGLLPMRGSRLRFEREIAALRELDHPGICPIVDDGEIDGVPFLAMPYVPGPSLRESFADGSISRDRLLMVLQQVAEALHHAHERGFVHRDVKPGNVILQPDGQAVLLDFGLARFDRPHGDGTLTVSGGVVGTPAYMAPEQVAGRSDVDRRCDVYAMGVLLYEGLTGKLPHEAPTRESLYRQILTGDVARPSNCVGGLPDGGDAVCMMALQRDPGRRYENAALLAQDLGRLRAGLRPVARLPGMLHRSVAWARRYPVASSLMALLSVAFLGIAWMASEIHEQGDVDRARSKAEDAMRLVGFESDEALTLALEAYRVAEVPEALVAIQAALVGDRPAYETPPLDSPVIGMSFAPDKRWLLARTASGRGYLVQFGQRGKCAVTDLAASGVIRSAEFRPGAADPVFVTGSADGRIVASAPGQAGPIWSQELSAETGSAVLIRHSPDGTRLFCGTGREGKLLSPAGKITGECEFGGVISHMAWLDETRFVVAIASPGDQERNMRVCVWDVSLDPPREMLARDWAASVVGLYPNPAPALRHLVFVVEKKEAAIWDLNSDDVTRVVSPKPFGGWVVGGGWAPDGRRVFVGANGGRTEIYSLDGERRGYGDYLDDLTHIIGNPVFPVYAAIGSLGVVALASFETRFVRSLGRRRLRDAPMTYSADGIFLATSTWANAIQIWRHFDPELPVFYGGGETRSITWADGDRTIVQGSRTGANNPRQRTTYIRSWNIETGRQRHAARVFREMGLLDMRLDHSRTRAVVVHARGFRTPTRLLRRDGAKWTQLAHVPDDVVSGYKISAQFLDGQRVLLCSTEAYAVLWDTDKDEFQVVPEDSAAKLPGASYGRWNSAAATPDASTIWAAGSTGYLHRYDRKSDGGYREVPSVRFGDSVNVLLHLSDEHGVMVGGSNGLLARVLPNGRRIEFEGHRQRVLCLASTRLGGEVIVASGDRQGWIRLWHLDGKLMRAISYSHGTVPLVQPPRAAPPPLSGPRDGPARIWPVPPEALLDLARRRLR